MTTTKLIIWCSNEHPLVGLRWWVGDGFVEVTKTKPVKMNSHTQKRQRQSLESDEQHTTNNFERFIVIQSKEHEKPIKDLSVFIIEKSLEGSIGHPKSVKFLRNGDLLVETASSKQTENLLNCTSLFGISIVASLHKSLNSSKGIIRDPNLKNSSTSEIVENLKTQGVSSVRRISIKRSGTIIQTNTYVVTFNRPKPPPSLKVFYSSIKVDSYIPNPLRCFNCQKFGHHENNCKSSEVCVKCGQGASHHYSECPNKLQCVNCGKEHAANSNTCEIWKKEKEIIRIKVQQNKSYPEARKLYEQLTNPMSSFASVVAGSRQQANTTASAKAADPTPSKCQSCELLLKKLNELYPDISSQLKKLISPSTNVPSNSQKSTPTTSSSEPSKSTTKTVEIPVQKPAPEKKQNQTSRPSSPKQRVAEKAPNAKQRPASKSPASKSPGSSGHKSRSRVPPERKTKAEKNLVMANRFEGMEMDVSDPSDTSISKTFSPVRPPE